LMASPAKRGGKTADEVIREKEERLRTDPEYRGKAEAVETNIAERVRRLREAERPIVADLQRVGVDVSSVWDLVNTANPYPDALPVLLSHLARGGYPDRVMESLGRALAVKPSVAVWDELRALYLQAAGRGEEEGLAVALAASATKDEFPALVALLGETSRGSTRIHFLRPIKRLGGAEGVALLERLADDDLFGREATALLRRVKKRPGG
jgi:hypothetical protein